MAALAKTAVTIRRNYKDAGSKYSVFELTLVLTGQGTTTNTIDAATLNLTEIRGCSSACSDGNDVILPATPNYAGTILLLGGGASNAPADYTDTFHITVWGISA
jgi:hypothetical protein